MNKKFYVDLHSYILVMTDVIHFGHSSRLHVFKGPFELMSPEKDLKVMEREFKMREEDIQDPQASLARARD